MKTSAIHLLVGIFVFFSPPLCLAVSQTGQGNVAPAAKSKETLEIEKLRQEVVNLQLGNDNLKSPWTKLSSNAAFITAIVALLGVFATVWKQLAESKRQMELDRRQRELDREQREIENQRGVDQKFTSIVADLGSASEAIQASAAVSIVTFLKPEYKVLHDQVFAILLANLKIKHREAVNQLIVTAFEKALRGKFDRAKEGADKLELDLSRANLTQSDLSGLDLTNADLGFAQLRLANLTGTILFRARGYEANLEKARLSRANLNEARLQKARLNDAYLHECNLVATDMKEAELRGAQFQQAKMQAAHLEGADITGAKFEQANVSDTYFIGVKADAQALRSLVKACNWQKAHFDEEVRVKLEEMARG